MNASHFTNMIFINCKIITRDFKEMLRPTDPMRSSPILYFTVFVCNCRNIVVRCTKGLFRTEHGRKKAILELHCM